VSRRRLLGLVTLGAVMVAAAGCGAVAKISSGNPANGRTVFIAKCGSCHTLAEAKTTGTIGPNLDYAFAAAKGPQFSSSPDSHLSTIVDVVRGQIAYPDSKPGTVCVKGVKSKLGKGLSCTSTQGMTPNLVHGQDAKDVSVYVGLCAANPSCVVKNETVKIPS
jgi:hypothetical protein